MSQIDIDTATIDWRELEKNFVVHVSGAVSHRRYCDNEPVQTGHGCPYKVYEDRLPNFCENCGQPFCPACIAEARRRGY